jgi:phage-related protein
MADLDVVGGAAVDVVPIVPNFHRKLKTAVLPIADQVGAEAGRKMGERMGDTMRASLVGDAQRIGNDLGDSIGDALARRIATAIPDGITSGGRRSRPASTRAGDDNAGAFGRAFRSRLEVAFRSLPRPDIRLSTTGFDADLARVRARMETLSGKRIGVDVDAATAMAELTAIDARLAELGARSPNIQVRADIATARAELAAMQRQVNDLDRDDVNVKVRANTAQAHAALMQLAVAIGVVTALPVIPIAAAGIGAIASAALVAGAAMGALALAAVPAIKGVTSAIQAKTAAEQESARATDNSAAANVRAAQSALQMSSAQQALSAAHRNAAKSIATANRQVEDAERALGQAAARAMEQRRQAAENVERAERSLTDAKRQSLQAEEALTRAREDAARQLDDLNAQLERGKLDERDATLRVREAQEELNRVQAEYDAGKATALQLDRAQLAYDQSVQAAEQQRKDYAQLQKDAEAAKKAGVDGNEDVKRASEQLADAQRNVQDQTKAVTVAHESAAQAQVEAAQAVADAQRSMADAVSAASDAQVQAAEQIASAERGIESARLASVDTTARAVTKADEYREALAKLTPEQRALYASIAGPGGLTEAYKAWSKELQPDVLPIFTQAVDGAKRSLPGLTPLVRGAAAGIGELMDRASADLKGDPFWDRFKRGIAENAQPAIVGLGVAFGNVFKGMAGVLEAFFPHMDSISQRMQGITARFAEWGTSLRGSPEFEKFLDFVTERSPVVSEAFSDLGEALMDLAVTLEPFSTVFLKLLSYASDAISYVAEHAPWAIQAIYGLWIATKLWNLALAMNPIGAIILGLIGLALAVKYCWDNFEWFRDIVTGAWDLISGAAKWAWEEVLQPAFQGIWDAVKWVGDKLVWLWQNIFVPAWNFIATAAKIAAAILLTVVFTPIWLAIQAVGAILGWLWEECFKPTWDAISILAQWVWINVLEPVFQWIWDGVQWVGDKFVWLYDNAIKPAVDWIAAIASWLWEEAIKPALGWIWDGVQWVGDKFVWLYEHAIKPPADWIADKAKWLYDKGLKPAFDNIKSAVGLVGDAFGVAKDAIKKAWDKLVDITKKPVNFVIKWVYTNGIKAVWDKVASFVGLDPLPKAPKLLEAGGTVGDGWGVAKPMKVNRPTAIVGEGNPRYPEYVIPTDPRYRGRAKSLWQAAGHQLLESGGVIGGAWDWTKDTVGDVIGKGIDWAKTAADLIANPGDIWSKLTKPILSKVSAGVGTFPMGKALAKYPIKMVGGLKDKVVDAVTSFLGSGGGAGLWEKPVDAPFGTKFGVAGSMWASGHHTGLDFPAPAGTPIHAVADGRVIGVGRSGPYGQHLEISHGGGLTSLYAHMSKILADMGQVVAQGQTIGRVGATGNTTGPHLHLEARVNGRPVDPLPYIQGGGPLGSKSPTAAKAYAKSILPQFGWSAAQFAPLEKLWEGESNWRWNATNPSSGAYGIPQSLPASKMASAGSDWRTNPATQIRWGLNYIKTRPDYGSPAAAYSKWLSRSPHWYDDGGYLPPGLNLVANGTGRPEPVFTSGQWDDIRAAKSGGTTTLHADVKVFVGDREITDIVDTRIELHDAEAATDLNNGRWI